MEEPRMVVMDVKDLGICVYAVDIWVDSVESVAFAQGVSGWRQKED